MNVEAELGFFLNDTIRTFYKQMNGFQLRWISTKNPDFDRKKHTFSGDEFDIWEPLEKGHLPFDGYINILPIERLLDYESWEEVIWVEDDKDIDDCFLGKEMNLYDLLVNIRPFDFFSRSQSMAFYIDKKHNMLQTLLIQGELLDPFNSRITDFASYLEFLLATNGVIDEREKFYYKKMVTLYKL